MESIAFHAYIQKEQTKYMYKHGVSCHALVCLFTVRIMRVKNRIPKEEENQWWYAMWTQQRNKLSLNNRHIQYNTDRILYGQDKISFPHLVIIFEEH